MKSDRMPNNLTSLNVRVSEWNVMFEIKVVNKVVDQDHGLKASIQLGVHNVINVWQI